MTIKELADELGFTKQRIQQIIDKLPTNRKPLKQANRFVLTPDNVDDIKFLLGIDTNKSKTNERQTETVSEDNLIFVKQLKEKDEQIKMLHKLLDQQQQLTLQANIKIKELETTSMKTEEVEDDESKKKSFWERLFN